MGNPSKSYGMVGLSSTKNERRIGLPTRPELLQYYMLGLGVYLSRCCRLCCRRRTSPAATATKNHAKEKSKNSPGLSTAPVELDAVPADAGTSAAGGPSNSSAAPATVAGAAADAAGAESDDAAGGTASSPAASARSDAFIAGVKAVVVCGGSAAAVLAGGTTAGGAAPGAAAAGRSAAAAIASVGAAGASDASGPFARLTPVGAAEFTVFAAIIWACATTSAKFPFSIHV